MYDTISAFIHPECVLSDKLFQGASVTELFDREQVSARLWRNPEGEMYEPRVTYWRPVSGANGSEQTTLKVEFSVPKMAAPVVGLDVLTRTVNERDVSVAIERVDVFLEREFGLSGLRDWTVQRVDYAVNWDVGSLLPAYMSVFAKLRIGNWSRHPYDAAEGVVWKTVGTRGRWVKFYNKSKELGVAGGILRFEVSNYRDAVQYMTRRWFGSERKVSDVIQAGRALYVLALHWDKLGLGRSDEYGKEELELMRLREVFGKRVSTAHYVLRVLREYGTQAYRPPLELVSKSMFYRYREELVKHDFIAVIDDEHVKDIGAGLPALDLPYEDVFASFSQNLGDAPAPEAKGEKKIFWQKLAAALGLSRTKMSEYLVRAYGEYIAEAA